jgi:hypothetical protein
VVDELAGGFVRLIASFFHAIFQAVFEALFRAVFQIVFEIIGRGVLAFIRGVAYVGKLILWPADHLYHALFQRVRRTVRQSVLAHGLAIVLLMLGGFLFGASASTLYHGAHPTYDAASLVDQP